MYLFLWRMGCEWEIHSSMLQSCLNLPFPSLSVWDKSTLGHQNLTKEEYKKERVFFELVLENE